MKQYLFILLLFILVLSCSVKKGNFSNSYFNSKEIYDEFYEILKGSNFDSSIVESVKIFHINVNVRGKIIDSVLIDKKLLNNGVSHPISHAYETIKDSLERVVDIYEITNDSIIYLSVREIYGENKKIQEWTQYNFKGDFSSKYTCKYNEVDSLVHKEYYRWSTNCLQHTYDYYYSNDKLIKSIEKHTMKDCQELDAVLTKEYDDKGRLTNFEYFFLNPNNNKTYKYNSYSKHDEEGKLIENIIKQADKKISTKKYYYYPNGLPKEIKLYFNKNEKLKSIRRFYYIEVK